MSHATQGRFGSLVLAACCGGAVACGSLGTRQVAQPEDRTHDDSELVAAAHFERRVEMALRSSSAPASSDPGATSMSSHAAEAASTESAELPSTGAPLPTNAGSAQPPSGDAAQPSSGDLAQRPAGERGADAADADSANTCVANIHLTSGGLVLTYLGAGPERSLDDAVRRMAATHNFRHSTASAAQRNNPASVRSIALVENAGHGSRIVLVADDALDTADLYAHLEHDAPDLIPTGSLERGSCRQALDNSAATTH